MDLPQGSRASSTSSSVQISEPNAEPGLTDGTESELQSERPSNFKLLLVLLQLMQVTDSSIFLLHLMLLQWMRSVLALLSAFHSSIFRENTPRRIWQYNRGPGLDLVLLHTYNDLDFKRRLRISRGTFQYLCYELGPIMQRKNTKFRMAIPVENKIMMALTRLATGNTITGIADSFRVGYATVQNAVIEFAECVNTCLKELYIKWSSPARLKKLAEEFESIRGVQFVVGAIDGSHIPIIGPKISPQEYYNRKGFHSILLQVIVSSKGLIWDFDIGWPGSIHDWTLFQRSAGGHRIMSGFLAPYCLVGDAAYPPRNYMLSPFKGSKDGLSREQYYWNYVQSSTRMPVEQAFGRLKARFRILLKRNDMDVTVVAANSGFC